MHLKRLKEAREARGLKQYELAATAGISSSQMSRVEAGKRRLRLDEAEKIAAKLNLQASDIANENVVPPAGRISSSKSASLPLPEGQARLEYPAVLSLESRDDLTEWLKLLAQMISR